MRLALLLLLQPTLIGAPVVDEKLDDALWQKAREALGESPAATIVHSHFSKWLDDRLDAALGDDAGATGAGGVAAFVRNVSALPRRPVIGLRVAKRNASGLCAFVEEAVPALDRAKHIEAYALTSVGTAANGSPFHPHSLKGCEQACPAPSRSCWPNRSSKPGTSRSTGRRRPTPGTCPLLRESDARYGWRRSSKYLW